MRRYLNEDAMYRHLEKGGLQRVRKYEITLSILAVVMGIPSFGKHTIFGTTTLDGTKYTEMVLAFRGGIPFHTLGAPFNYRPLAPFLASMLPLNPGISFGIMNMVFCIVIVLTVFWNCRELNIDDASAFKASAIVAISWNILLYGTTVHVDPGLVMCWSIFLLAVTRGERFIVLFSIAVLAILFKEIALLMSLTIIFYDKIRGIFTLAVQSALILLVRVVMSVGTVFENTIGYLWWIDVSRNLNLIPLAEIPLTLGLILPGAYIGYINNSDITLAPTVIPAILVVIIGFLYGAFCGRFIWMLQIALAPILGKGLQIRIQKSSHQEIQAEFDQREGYMQS
ncbi:MAG: hypothetical protein ACXABZ_12315 [Candidatus Thorarchaeota archaeon]|jgi:hypothetical protein